MHKRILFFCSDGLPFIMVFLFVLLVAGGLTVVFPHPILIGANIVCCLLFLEICYFFRDPERSVPNEKGIIVAPADGKIISIKTMEEKSFLRAECVRVSTFMNVFSVHVNRAPISGRVTYCHYNPGKFISAFKEKASLDNEQFSIGIEGGREGSKQIRVLAKLIAGLVARRIVVWKSEGDDVSKGERMSLIKLGSRVDLYLPPETELKVKEGEWVKAGETVIGAIE